MSREYRFSQSARPDAPERDDKPRSVVGKRTLVETLDFSWARHAAVQMAVRDAPSHDPAVVKAAAAHGTSGTATALPYRERIQQLFGRHDVSGVRAYVGGSAAEGAAAMGAQAYATGDQIAFATQPDLHTAAHEAAHVVQQRGGVQLKGGVGQVGDRYEQHADAVADLVVQGTSAEGLLDTLAGNGAAAAGVQRRIVDGEGQPMEWDAVAGALGPRAEEARELWADDNADYTMAEVREALGIESPSSSSSVTFKKRGKRKQTNFRQPTKEDAEPDVEPEGAVVKPAAKPKKPRDWEPQDSAFEKWVKANHLAHHADWMEFDNLLVNDAMTDVDGTRTVERALLAGGAIAERLRIIRALRSAGVSWSDLRDLTRDGQPAEYDGHAADAVTYLGLFGVRAVCHYRRAELAGFQNGNNNRGQQFFVAHSVDPAGVAHGAHLRAHWDLHVGALASVVQDWADTIGGGAVTQYRYQDTGGGNHRKTVFADIATADALLDKAVRDGIRTRVARAAGAWNIDAQLDGGHRVTVRFDGTALHHIT